MPKKLSDNPKAVEAAALQLSHYWGLLDTKEKPHSLLRFSKQILRAAEEAGKKVR